ncbi:hypothetical protein CRE_29276 [Caenorhabditis remanei]|uniref:non-specific serine/threonine protein kinase n=1 Tax=Caenorhabditis remanei TaxID=31234 RepID=E3NR49_CAERE|nr:hypothetical protein CRE_29276 [Caenorhabditis remanei]
MFSRAQIACQLNLFSLPSFRTRVHPLKRNYRVGKLEVFLFSVSVKWLFSYLHFFPDCSDNDSSDNHAEVQEVAECPSVSSEKELTLKTAAVESGNLETVQPNEECSTNISKENEIASTSHNQSEENEATSNGATSINRKAETSMTEMLDEAEEEESCQPNQEDTKYAKKRQRTKSPETMCHGMSTVMTMQNDQGMSTVLTMQNDQGMSTIMTMQNDQEEQHDYMQEVEKENAVQKRGTLQPQQRQLARESRVSRLSVMSAASSCHDSINSAMEDMSLDQKYLEETMGDDVGRSQLFESRVDSRNVPTGMTIHNEDPSLLPFYLADGTFEVAPSTMGQLLHVAGQKEAKTWSSLPKTALDGRRVKKLGEGSYGEVFSTVWEGKPVAIKVVPFEADENNRLYTGEYHSERMQTADQILPELIVMKELNQLKNMTSLHSTPNFIELIAAEIVTGNYPKGLLKAWDTYTASVKESENTRPDIYSSNDQKFIVIVSANGGVALEDFVLKSENEMLSILHQLILSMLAAESLLEFEHRDLHLGNVLIDRCGVEELDYMIGGHKIPLKAHGVKVNIIDFTLSRISKGPTTVFLDLENDPGVFEGTGDPQFDVYRQMRANCNGNWIKFENRTNLMWIEYIAHCLIDTEICPEGMLTKKRKEVQYFQSKFKIIFPIQELRQLFKQLGQFESCQASLMDTDFYEKFYIGYFGDVAKPQEDIYSDSE